MARKPKKPPNGMFVSSFAVILSSFCNLLNDKFIEIYISGIGFHPYFAVLGVFAMLRVGSNAFEVDEAGPMGPGWRKRPPREADERRKALQC